MDFDQEGVPGGSRGPTQPGGAQPQTFDDVAREIHEKCQPARLSEMAQINEQLDAEESGQSPGQHPSQLVNDAQEGGGATGEPGSTGLSAGRMSGTGYSHSEPLQPQLASHVRNSTMPNQRNQALSGQVRPTSQALLSEEECLTSYPNELLCALLEVLTENFREAKVHPSDHVARLSELVRGRVARPVVKDIHDKYLDQNRIQLSQFVHRLTDRCKELEIDRKNLQYRVQRAKLDMKRVEYSGQANQQVPQRQHRSKDEDYRDGDLEQSSVE